MSRDSAFALGTAVRYLKYPAEVMNIEYNSIIFEVLKYLGEAEYLPVSTIALLIGHSRGRTQKLMAKMWRARLVKCIEVNTYSTPSMSFKLWISMAYSLPKSANDACRLAMLGAFYGRIKKEMPGLEWILIKARRGKGKNNVNAEMTYLSGEKKDKITLLIDAPRRGEKPNTDADIYIFPTVEEAKIYTPNGKRFTTDIILMNREISFSNLISDPVENTN